MWWRAKGRLKARVRASLGHSEGRLHRLVSRFMLATSVAYFRSSNGRLAAFSSSGSGNESVAVAEVEPDSDDYGPLPPLPHEAFLLVKPAPKLLRFIRGTRRIFQELMGPLLTPRVNLKHYMICGFRGISSVIGLSLRHVGMAAITLGSLCGAMTSAITSTRPRLSLHCVRRITTRSSTIG